MRDDAPMILLAFTRQTGLRIAEIGLALTAVAGAALVLGAITTFGSKRGNAVAGLALAAGSVLLIVAFHWSGLG